jgi:hypothetical protein
MLHWFSVFYDNINDLTNISNTNVDHIKRAFWNIFININYKKIWFEVHLYESDFYILLQYISIHLMLISINNSNVIKLNKWIRFFDSRKESESNRIFSNNF